MKSAGITETASPSTNVGSTNPPTNVNDQRTNTISNRVKNINAKVKKLSTKAKREIQSKVKQESPKTAESKRTGSQEEPIMILETGLLSQDGTQAVHTNYTHVPTHDDYRVEKARLDKAMRGKITENSTAEFIWGSEE